MAKYAYRVPNGTENDRVDASDLPLHGNGTFYCTTPDCRARMYVRSPQKPSACFLTDLHANMRQVSDPEHIT